MKLNIIALSMASVLFVASCANVSKQEQGTVAGAIIGAAAGSAVGSGSGRTIAMVLGGIFGASIGSNIGKQLDERDRAMMDYSRDNALEYGKTNQISEWHNPDSGNSGTYEITKTYHDSSKQKHCREFTQTIMVGGEEHEGYGTACRKSDGSWEIQ